MMVVNTRAKLKKNIITESGLSFIAKNLNIWNTMDNGRMGFSTAMEYYIIKVEKSIMALLNLGKRIEPYKKWDNFKLYKKSFK